MHLLLIGCECAGKKTPAMGVSRWMIAAMGLPLVRWNNHYVAPRLDGRLVVRGEGEATVRERFHRNMIWRRLNPDMHREDDALSINHYCADAV